MMRRSAVRARGARLRVFALALGVVASSCTIPGHSRHTFTPPPSVDVGGDRLVVLHNDGNLVTLGPDGRDMLALTTVASDTLVVQQPVASPDGRFVAWVEIQGTGSRVAIASRDGTEQHEIELQYSPFFLQWDPTSSKIAYLGNVGAGIGLGVIEQATEEPTDRAVGGGQPLYVSWSPDGTQMLVHVGSRDLGRTDFTHSLDRIDAVPGTFQAPAWLPDGRQVYVTRVGSVQHLVVTGRGDRRVVATFRGGVLFDASPDGARLAYRLDRPGGAQQGVFVVDVDRGRPVRVTQRETSAFFWSPRSDALLLMTVEPGAQVEQTHRWWLWDGRARPVSKPFLPSATFFNEYVPFFDQYAQALTPWAPDGSAFAFAGLVGRRSGIWVQPADGSRATRVPDGRFVAWSPAAPRRSTLTTGGVTHDMSPSGKPGYVVFKLVGKDRWQLVGEADRTPGHTAKAARGKAIDAATGGKAKPGDVYRAVLRSEWRIAGEL
jgi:TolB protein